MSTTKQEVSQIQYLVSKLQSITTDKDNQIGVLEARIYDFEPYPKNIISGLKTSVVPWNRHLFSENCPTEESAPLRESSESVYRIFKQQVTP